MTGGDGSPLYRIIGAQRIEKWLDMSENVKGKWHFLFWWGEMLVFALTSVRVEEGWKDRERREENVQRRDIHG